MRCAVWQRYSTVRTGIITPVNTGTISPGKRRGGIMMKPKKNLRYANSAGKRTAKDRRNVLRDTANNSSEREDFPYLPELPGRAECALAAGFGAFWCGIATSPLWWGCEDFPIAAAVLGGAVLCYGILRATVYIRWEKHCRDCREYENSEKRASAEKAPVPVWLRSVECRRKPDTFGGYIPREVICTAAHRDRRR